MTVINSDEWELVGGVYRRKKRNNGWGWLIAGAFVLMTLAALS